MARDFRDSCCSPRISRRSIGTISAYLAELAANGRLQVELDLVTSWNDARSAFAALRERRVHGKAVLRID